MTFASRKQHRIYWGPLKKPLEWSLKTWLAPWAYVASVVYHDIFWYPFMAQEEDAGGARERVGPALRNWERLTPDEKGFPDVGAEAPELTRTGLAALGTSIGILATCLKEAPELQARRRRAEARHAS